MRITAGTEALADTREEGIAVRIDEAIRREIVKRVLDVTSPQRIILLGSAATGAGAGDVADDERVGAVFLLDAAGEQVGPETGE